MTKCFWIYSVASSGMINLSSTCSLLNWYTLFIPMDAHSWSTRNVLLLNIPTFENNRLLLPSRLPSEPARNMCWRHQLNLLNDRLLLLQRTICKLEIQPKNALVLVLDIQFVLFYVLVPWKQVLNDLLWNEARIYGTSFSFTFHEGNRIFVEYYESLRWKWRGERNERNIEMWLSTW